MFNVQGGVALPDSVATGFKTKSRRFANACPRTVSKTLASAMAASFCRWGSQAANRRNALSTLTWNAWRSASCCCCCKKPFSSAMERAACLPCKETARSPPSRTAASNFLYKASRLEANCSYTSAGYFKSSNPSFAFRKCSPERSVEQQQCRNPTLQGCMSTSATRHCHPHANQGNS